jgi:hypothetical protein
LELQVEVQGQASITHRRRFVLLLLPRRFLRLLSLLLSGISRIFLFHLFLFFVFHDMNLITFIYWQDVDGGGNRPRDRLLETEYDTLPFGETGDESLTSIPFQVST